MKITRSLHGNDQLELSWWDLFRIAIGRTVTQKFTALEIRRK
jgi:hypothetical protein